MGSPFSVTLANIFMYYLERDHIDSFRQFLLHCGRFTDDLFGICNGSREMLIEFL